MDNEADTIAVTKREIRRCLLLACTQAIILFLNFDPVNEDVEVHGDLIEKEVEKIIEMMWNKRRD